MIEWLLPMLLPGVIQACVGLVMIGGERERRKQLSRDIEGLAKDMKEKADRGWVEGEFRHNDRRVTELEEWRNTRRVR